MVGISLFIVVYVLKFFTIPLAKEMTSSEFTFSVTAALLLVFGGTAARLFLFYTSLSQSKEIGQELVAYEDRVHGRRIDGDKEANKRADKARGGMS